MNPIFPLKTDKTHRNVIAAWHLTTMLPVAEGICWLGLLQLHLWWHPNHTRIDRSGFKVRVEGWETLSMKHPNTAYVLDLVCNLQVGQASLLVMNLCGDFLILERGMNMTVLF